MVVNSLFMLFKPVCILCCWQMKGWCCLLKLYIACDYHEKLRTESDQRNTEEVDIDCIRTTIRRGINMMKECDNGSVSWTQSVWHPGLPGKLFKPFLNFFWGTKTFFSQFLWKKIFSLFFSLVFIIAPKCPFQSLYLQKNSWGRTPSPPPVEGKALSYPPHMPHWGASRYGASLHAILSHTKKISVKKNA